MAYAYIGEEWEFVAIIRCLDGPAAIVDVPFVLEYFANNFSQAQPEKPSFLG
jgi:hypothetical protein